MENSVSIIVCFYNAGKKLIDTIKHLSQLDVSSIENIELIFVNNNSTDHSVTLIKNELSNFSIFPWKIIDEHSPGLSNARLAGINESRYDTLLFCDDDNWLSSDYLQKGLAIIGRDKEIAVLGGLGSAVSDIALPNWFSEHLNYYAVGPQAPSSGVVRGTRNVVYGAGMFVRKSYFQALQEKGFASYSSDRVGKQLTSGGDSEMCLVFQVAGFKIWYDDGLTFKHYIEPSRLTLDYLNRLKKGMSGSRYLIRFYLEYLNGYIPKVGPLFWFKELLYNLKELSVNVLLMRWKALPRNFSFASYLLKERKKYNENVAAIIEFCGQLQTIKSKL